MKTIILFLFFSCSIFSQHIVVSKIDEFTKKEIIQANASKEPKWKTTDNIAKGFFNNVFLSLHKEDTKNILMLDMTYGTNICVSNNDGKAIILFENDTTLELPQVSKIDCALRVAVQYYLQNNDIEQLSKSIIKKIRIYTTDGHISFEIKEDKKELIKNTFNLFLSKI